MIPTFILMPTRQLSSDTKERRYRPFSWNRRAKVCPACTTTSLAAQQPLAPVGPRLAPNHPLALPGVRWKLAGIGLDQVAQLTSGERKRTFAFLLQGGHAMRFLSRKRTLHIRVGDGCRLTNHGPTRVSLL